MVKIQAYRKAALCKPIVGPCPGTCLIPLTQDKWAIVDRELYAELIPYNWAAVQYAPGHWYAARAENGHTILMHRVLLNPSDGMEIDHINGNGLDNRLANLRACSHKENMQNRRPRKKRYLKDQKQRRHREWRQRTREAKIAARHAAKAEREAHRMSRKVTYTRFTENTRQWLLKQRDADAPTMAAVIRRIVKEAMQREIDKPEPADARPGG